MCTSGNYVLIIFMHINVFMKEMVSVLLNRDAPKLKLLAEAEQNETLDRIPNTHFFLMYFAIFFTIA